VVLERERERERDREKRERALFLISSLWWDWKETLRQGERERGNLTLYLLQQFSFHSWKTSIMKRKDFPPNCSFFPPDICLHSLNSNLRLCEARVQSSIPKILCLQCKDNGIKHVETAVQKIHWRAKWCIV
jgi:hypothetical protein